jgi:c-di-GMP-binding flagellar brake protein YcgR
METLPMPLDELSRAPGGLDDFRISAPSEVLAYLKQLLSGNVVLNLVGADGPGVPTTVWAVDPARGSLTLSADLTDADMQRLLATNQSVAVGYLDNVKLQFDASGLTVAGRGKQGALTMSIPKEIFRFQRRDAYRVRTAPRFAPSAYLRHPAARGEPLELRVLDLSIGGCALLVPAGSPPMEPGMMLEGVHIDLDGNNTMRCTLMLHHVSSVGEGLADDPGSLRIGCELMDIGPDSRRILQRFVDQAQQRRRATLAL